MIRRAAEALADECGRLCCSLGIHPALRESYRRTVEEPVPPDMLATLDRLQAQGQGEAR
jgi:hypothetical protein